VYALYRSQPPEEARLVSDDRRFIRRLAMVGVTAQTPGAVLVALGASGGAERARVLSWLQAMRPLISLTEYEACRRAIEEVG
jgi:hypothetical protein